jgi:hypothetical protein
MGKKTASAPASPDPTATAAAQAAANKETAVAQAHLNMVNQYTPQGSLEYTQRGTASDGTPQYSATQTFSPEQQALYDLTNQAAQKYGQTANTQLNSVSNTLSQPLDFSSLGNAPQFNDAYRTQVENAMYDRLQPQIDKDRNALITQLANQGITDPGSQAYMTAIDEINRKQNDLRLGITSQGLSQAAQQYGLETGGRNQQINEMIQQRQIPLNELAAMLSGSQVQSPSFVNAPQTQIGQTPLADSVYGSYNGQLQAYGANQAANSANTQGLYGLLGTGALASAMYWSDRKLKTDIEPLGKLPNGLTLYRFNYVWGGDHVGVMADEAREKFPHAVHRMGGFDIVDYSALEAA